MSEEEQAAGKSFRRCGSTWEFCDGDCGSCQRSSFSMSNRTDAGDKGRVSLEEDGEDRNDPNMQAHAT